MLEVFQRLNEMVMSLPSQILGVSFGFGRDREVKQPEPPVPKKVDCCEDVVPINEELGNLRRPLRQRQRERDTEGLMSGAMAVHVGENFIVR